MHPLLITNLYQSARNQPRLPAIAVIVPGSLFFAVPCLKQSAEIFQETTGIKER